MHHPLGKSRQSARGNIPIAIISSELFEIDRDRYTCSGGVAPLDMMLNLLEARHGHRLAAMISEEFICERIRRRNDRQRTPLKMHLGTSQPKLVEAISLMEANLQEPMNLDELASHVGFSRRQLERLFQRHIHCVPRRYYLELRLDRARRLLAANGDADHARRPCLRFCLRRPFQQVLPQCLRPLAQGRTTLAPALGQYFMAERREGPDKPRTPFSTIRSKTTNPTSALVREHLSRIHEIVGIKSVLDELHDLQSLLSVLLVHIFDLAVADPVLAGTSAAHLLGPGDHAIVEGLRSGELLRIIGIQNEGQMEIAIPDMTYDRGDQPGSVDIGSGLQDAFGEP